MMPPALHILFSNSGSEPSDVSARHLLARFPVDMRDSTQAAYDFSIPLPVLGDSTAVEHWYVDGGVRFEQSGNLQLAVNEHFLLARITHPGVPADLRQLSLESYQSLLEASRQQGFAHILKFWNFVPGINAGSGDEENYKQFCVGRAEAFQQAGTMECYVPAGTAIGNDISRGLTVYLLAAKTAPRAVENPRQVSAYHYPRQYGPRSPSFSRAACFSPGTGRKAMLLSGTAAIVGHETFHDGDGAAQVMEMRSNVAALLREAGMPPLSAYGSEGECGAAMRLFVRPGEQQQAIVDCYAEHFPELVNTLILEADICRQALQVEIDGVFWAPA